MLLEVRDRTGVKIQEAFMVLTNPQWFGVRRADRVWSNWWSFVLSPASSVTSIAIPETFATIHELAGCIDGYWLLSNHAFALHLSS